MNPTEQVLCIHRNRLPGNWVAEKAIVPMALNEFTRQCRQSGFEFIDRPAAEKNPGMKQVIPYIVIQSTDRTKTAIYLRQGSEERLHDLWSLGIGGHINPMDSQGPDTTFEEILMAGMARELEEELRHIPRQDIPLFSGIISEDVTEVGSVHLGAVFRILTPTPDAYAPGPELTRFNWHPTDRLSRLNLELWSVLALDLLGQVTP